MPIDKKYDENDFKDNNDNGNLELDEKSKIIVDESIPEESKDEDSVEEKSVLGNFDATKISDINYLSDIFSKKYDKFNSLQYLKKNHESMLEQGYPQTPALNEYLFWTTLSRRLQIIYNMTHKSLYDNLGKNDAPDASESIKLLDMIQKTTAHIDKLQKAVDGSLETTRKVRDVVDLHRETCEKAEKFLKAHFGEYIKADSIAGKLKTITDRAHWAFVSDTVRTELGEENVDYVWSEELKFLLDKKLIPIEYMAFALQTSIEALYYVAKIRQNDMPNVDRDVAEQKLKELMLESESLRHELDKDIVK